MSLVERLLGAAAEEVVEVQTEQAPVVSEDRQTWLCDVVCNRKDEVALADRHWSGRPGAIVETETRRRAFRNGRIDLADANRVLQDALVPMVLIADARDWYRVKEGLFQVFAYKVISCLDSLRRGPTAPINLISSCCACRKWCDLINNLPEGESGDVGRCLRDEQLGKTRVCDGIGGKSVATTVRQKLHKKALADLPPSF